ncbi:MAG: nucleoside phosphorylase [Christensenellaceae bacterium]|jgi:uridine phosphorylase|nr:nucleoside phosphorylase [Christensenellaceae bacterium]
MKEFYIDNTQDKNSEIKVESIKEKNKIKRSPIPILEYDSFAESITQVKKDIYPNKHKIKRCVITYFQDVIAKLENNYVIFQAFRLRIEGVRPRVYELKINEKEGKESIYVLLCPLGAPQAARMMEILSAIGIKKFVVCGGAGTLDNTITDNKILLATSAVRDEGTSYHYLPPARIVKIASNVRNKMIEVLKKEKENFCEIKTWTTDASFRETPAKVQLRKNEGCVTVEMECSAYYAVAKFKKISCGQLLYAGDVVKKEGWDYRDWHSKTDIREHLFNLSVKCVLAL